MFWAEVLGFCASQCRLLSGYFRSQAGARKLPDLGDKHEGLKDEPVTLCIASKFKRFDVVMKDASKFVKSVAEIRGAQRTFP